MERICAHDFSNSLTYTADSLSCINSPSSEYPLPVHNIYHLYQSAVIAYYIVDLQYLPNHEQIRPKTNLPHDRYSDNRYCVPPSPCNYNKLPLDAIVLSSQKNIHLTKKTIKCIFQFSTRQSCKEDFKILKNTDISINVYFSMHTFSIKYLEENNLNEQINKTSYNTKSILNYRFTNLNFKIIYLKKSDIFKSQTIQKTTK